MVWMGAMANVATITAYDTTSFQDNIVFAAVAELKFLMLKKTSTATIDGEEVWAASPSGRWHLTGGTIGTGGGGLATVSGVAPTTIAPTGTIYIWKEDTSLVYSADVEGRFPDSTITYVSNGTVWVEISANIIIYSGDPTFVGKEPNSVQESWLDTSTGTLYRANVDSSSVLS